LSSQEFTEWQAYYRHDPFGGFRGDLNAATIARTIAGVFLGAKAPETLDFIPTFWKPEPDEDEEEAPTPPPAILGAKINAALGALGGLRPTERPKSYLVPKQES